MTPAAAGYEAPMASEDKGEWAQTADEGIVPADLGGTDADEGMLPDDPELGSSVTGETTGDDEPATAEGIDLEAGDNADAVTDGGPDVPQDAEPDLKDIAAAQRERDQ
jgi:hypothetical protein